MGRNNWLLRAIVALGSGFLSACAPDMNLAPTDSSFNALHGPVSAVSISKTGERFTRFLATGSEPIAFKTESLVAYDPRQFFVTDVAFAFKEVSGLPLVKLRFAPRNYTQELINSWPAYAEAEIFDTQGGPANRVTVKLPADRTLGPRGYFESEWTLCPECVGITPEGATYGTARRDRLLAYARDPSQAAGTARLTLVKNPSRTALVGNEATTLLARVVERTREKELAEAQRLKSDRARKARETAQAERLARLQQDQTDDSVKKQRNDRANNDALPAGAQRDLLVVQIADMLKKGESKSALPLFEKLNALPVPIDPRTDYYWGHSL